jgi:hypothetical protein
MCTVAVAVSAALMLSLPPEYSGMAFQTCQESFMTVCTIMAISTLQKGPECPILGTSKVLQPMRQIALTLMLLAEGLRCLAVHHAFLLSYKVKKFPAKIRGGTYVRGLDLDIVQVLEPKNVAVAQLGYDAAVEKP